MQIEITKGVLTLMGNLSKGDVLNTDPKVAQMLISVGAAKVREADVPAVEAATEAVPPVAAETEPAETPKKARKAAKAEPE